MSRGEIGLELLSHAQLLMTRVNGGLLGKEEVWERESGSQISWRQSGYLGSLPVEVVGLRLGRLRPEGVRHKRGEPSKCSRGYVMAFMLYTKLLVAGTLHLV